MADAESSDDGRAEPAQLGFVCVRNAGRSQMAAAFARRERETRGLDHVTIVTGGTRPADAVHEVVQTAMSEVGINLSDREPRTISDRELQACDVVATMGCSTLELGEVAGVDVREWDLPDPGEAELHEVKTIRETIEQRVAALFDELDAG